MRVATFNIDSLDVPPKATVALEDRIPLLRPQLERLKADILCLQEINGQRRPGTAHRSLTALDKVLEGTRYQSFARATTTAPNGDDVADVHNLVTLSRWPISNFHSVRNALVPPLSYRAITAVPAEAETRLVGFERPILIAEIELDAGRTLTVVNVHFRAPLASPIAGQKESAFVWKSVAGWAEAMHWRRGSGRRRLWRPGSRSTT